MNINFNATVELKPSDVEKIVRDAITRECPNMSITEVEFVPQTETRGHSNGSYDVTVFGGCKVSLRPKAA